MARKRFNDEEILNLLRQVELSLTSGSDVSTAYRTTSVSDATYTKDNNDDSLGLALIHFAKQMYATVVARSPHQSILKDGSVNHKKVGNCGAKKVAVIAASREIKAPLLQEQLSNPSTVDNKFVSAYCWPYQSHSEISDGLK